MAAQVSLSFSFPHFVFDASGRTRGLSATTAVSRFAKYRKVRRVGGSGLQGSASDDCQKETLQWTLQIAQGIGERWVVDMMLSNRANWGKLVERDPRESGAAVALETIGHIEAATLPSLLSFSLTCAILF